MPPMKLTAALLAALLAALIDTPLAAQTPALLLRDSPGMPPTPAMLRRANPLAWNYFWDQISAAELRALTTKARAQRANPAPASALEWHPSAPTQADFKDIVAPALVKALSTWDRGLQAPALIALAELGPLSGLPDLPARFTKLLASEHEEVQEATALAFGILGDDAGLEPLTALLADTSAGRKLAGIKNGRQDLIGATIKTVPEPLRAAAAIALGLLGERTTSAATRRAIFAELTAVFELESTSAARPPDLRVACLLAMGILPFEDDGALKQAARLLIGVFQDESRETTVRSHAATATCQQLVRLGDAREIEAATEVFLDELRPKPGASEADELLAKSAVLALGELGGMKAIGLDGQVRKRLFSIAKSSHDAGVRGLALVALGRLASHAREEDEKAVREIAAHLEFYLREGHDDVRPWAAIGTGLFLQGLNRRVPDGLEAKALDKLALTLGTQLEEAKSDAAAPLAVAAGLSGRRDFGPLLSSKFKTNDETEAHGYLGQALGMLASPKTREAVCERFLAATYYRLELQLLAPSLALAPDSTTATTLLAALEKTNSRSAQNSIATALASLADRSVITPLIDGALESGVFGSARGSGLSALGMLAHPSRAPWQESYTTHFAYFAPIESFTGKNGLTGIFDLH